MIFRKSNNTKDGWNHGDKDVAFQLFSCGMVWDGNICSKESRDYLIEHGYAVRREGFTALTGKGAVAFLLHRSTWASICRRWYLWKRNPLVATASQIKSALH